MYSQMMCKAVIQGNFLSRWPRGLLRSIWQNRLQVLTLLVAIQISLLGPLTCIFHCHVLPLISRPSSNVSSSSTSLYFCHIISETQADPVLPTRISLPVSIQPLVLIGIVTIGSALLLLSRMTYQPQLNHTQMISAPPTPPPRFV